MSQVFQMLPILLLAMVIAYVLGSLPFADQISRRHGVNIFAVGTGLAGASNVRRYVGTFPALLVFLGDLGKGALAVLAGSLLGIEGWGLLAVAAAAIVGHWKSVFTGFRGGDGFATLGGVTLALFHAYALVALAAAMLVALGSKKLPYPSPMSVVMGYGTLVSLSVAYDQDVLMALGSGGLAAMVLLHALIGHWRRRHTIPWAEEADPDGQPRRA